MRRLPLTTRILFLFGLSLAAANPASGVPYFWDTDSATAGAGGGVSPNGTWSAGGTTLSTNSAGTVATGAVTTATGDSVAFSAGTTATGSYTVTVSGTQTIGTLTFEEGTPSLVGGTLDFRTAAVGISGTFTVNPSITADVSSVVAGGAGTLGTGSGGMAKMGTGTLTLSGTGTNTYPGQFLVFAGTLNLHGVHTDDGAARILRLRGNSTLNLYGTETTTGTSQVYVGEVTSGTQNLNIYGALNVNGSNGIFIAQNTANLNGTLTVKNGGVLNVGSTGEVVLGNNNASANGTLTIESGGTATITAGDFFSIGRAGAHGTLNLDGGTLSTGRAIRGSNSGAGGSATVNFNGGALRAIDADNAAWVNPSLGTSAGNGVAVVKAGGAIFDTNGFNMGITDPLIHDAALGSTPDGGLTKRGAGTLTLSGVNTYTGATVVRAGTLALSHAGNNNLANSSVLQVNSGATLNVSGLGGSTDLVLASGQTLQGKGTIVGNVTAGSGSMLSPGTSPGVLTMDNLVLAANSISFFEIGGVSTPGVDFDQIQSDDTLTYQNGWILRLRFTAFIEGTHTIQLFDFGGYSGGFLPTIEFDFSGADSYSFTPSTGELTFTNAWIIVPEPSSWLLCTLGLAAFGGLAYRRQRRKPQR